MANDILKRFARDNKVPLWRIADVLGIHEVTLVRRLRHELSDEDRFLIESIIKELSGETADHVADR